MIVITSCYVPKFIILTWSCFVPTWIVHIRSWCYCVATSGASLTHCALFTFVYTLPSEFPNGILFIKQYFQIKITNNCNMYSIIQESWNIQASKCLTCTLVYTWWHRWRPGMFWNILVLRDATGNATLLLFWLWCHCKVYWNLNVPTLRAQQKMMQSQISYEIFIVNKY